MRTTNLKEFTAKIKRIIFDDGKGFKILALSDVQSDDEEILDLIHPKFNTITAKGTIYADEGDVITIDGRIVKDSKYGDQFLINHHIKDYTDIAGIINYLTSDRFVGIGAARAEELINTIIENNENVTLNNILDHIANHETPESLSKLKGITEHIAEVLIKELKENFGKNKIMAELATYIQSENMRENLYEAYESKAIKRLANDPYDIYLDKQVDRFTFNFADEIATKLGINYLDRRRLRAVVLGSLKECHLESGDTIISDEKLLNHCYKLGGSMIPEELLREMITIQENKGHLYKLEIDTIIYYQLKMYQVAELGIVTELARLLDNTVKIHPKVDDEKISKTITEIEKLNHIQYDDSQKHAINQAVKHDLLVITGGPGTGKTTTIKGILETLKALYNYDTSKKDVVLAAPTGRAASRMSETVQLPAQTIHALLKIRPFDTRISDVMKMEDDYEEYGGKPPKLIIIDEFSMVDTLLTHQLLYAIPTGTKVIIVGDADQLPSVAPGQVLKTFLDSDRVPSKTLKMVHRQANGSTIPLLAEAIKHAEFPDEYTTHTANTKFVNLNLQMSALDQMIAILKNALTKYDSKDIQIIAPQHKGDLGVTNLNKICQELINPRNEMQPELLYGNYSYRINDRVINKKNVVMESLTSKHKNIITNGDMGIIVDMKVDNPKEKADQDYLDIDFNNSITRFFRKDWVQLELSYAITIHKSQGGEFPLVIIPIFNTYYKMLNRNLIYTAITRASDTVLMYGNPIHFKQAVKVSGTMRKTGLDILLSPSKSTIVKIKKSKKK